MARRDYKGSGENGWRTAMSVAVTALFLAGAAPGKALALSELPRENLPIPENSGQPDTIERHDLPPPGGAKEPETEIPQDTAPAQGAGDDDPEQKPAPEPMPADADEPSQTQRNEAPRAPSVTVPFPDPIVIPRDPDKEGAEESNGEQAADEPLPDVLYDLSLLPEPVRQMRQSLIDACLSGDIERLRPFISTGENATQLSFGDVTGDPVAFLRGLSGDEQGHEILAILYEILTAGFVKVGETPQQEMYVWPYFAAMPLDALTPPQRVELFKVVTAGDYEDMKNYGTYIFYRTGISPDGRWLFFYAGD